MLRERKRLGRTELMVSPVGFGVLPMGPWQKKLPVAEGAAVIRHALERGIDFLDTAQYYKTYPYIREALRGSAFSPVISSKSYASDYRGMLEAIEECRAALDRDRIDIYLLHEVRSPEDLEQRAGALEALVDARAKGWIGALGLSTHHVDVCQLAARRPEMDVVFPLINMAGIGIRKGEEAGSKEEMEAAIAEAVSADKGVFLMKAFGGGNLTPRYREALDYVYGLSGPASVMVGFSSVEEVDALLAYLDGSLPQDYVPKISGKRIHIDKGDCRGCGACIRRCPNGALHYGPDGLAEVDHSKCLTCGYCAPQCPVLAILLY